MFDKFLGKKPPEKAAPGQRRPRGRPRKPDHELSRPRPDPSRYSKKTGKLLPSKRKYKYKRPHYKHRRKLAREKMRRERLKSSRRAKEAAYTQSLWRKYQQSKQVAHRAARRRELDSATYYQLTYDDWVLLWATTPDVMHEPSGRSVPAASITGSPYKSRWNTYAKRLDSSKPYTKDNMAVWYDGKPLPNKINGLVES